MAKSDILTIRGNSSLIPSIQAVQISQIIKHLFEGQEQTLSALTHTGKPSFRLKELLKLENITEISLLLEMIMVSMASLIQMVK